MAKKTMTTQEILAAARAEVAKKSGGETDDAAQPEESAAAEAEASSAETPADKAPEQPASAESSQEEAPKKPADKPSSTKDVLVAARAEAAAKGGGGGKEKPSGKEKPKPAAGGSGKKPTSTKDILAAARAEAAGGGAQTGEAPAKKVEKSSPKPKAPSAKKPSGEKPSVQEMLKAVREGRKSGAGEPRKPTPAKPRPGKGEPGKEEAGETRRNFLVAMFATPFAAAWSMLTLASIAALLGLARFMFPNVLVEPPTKFKVGPPNEYPSGSVSTKWKSQFGIWMVHTQYEGKNLIYGLLSVCTHLGCTPNWLEGEQKFKCPCHGSGFYITGVNFEGPAPRPLERVAIRLAEDGMLEVDKSQTFQQELGQWEDPASFVEVV